MMPAFDYNSLKHYTSQQEISQCSGIQNTISHSIRPILWQQSGSSYFVVGLSIQTCCGNKTSAVISARLQQY